MLPGCRAVGRRISRRDHDRDLVDPRTNDFIQDDRERGFRLTVAIHQGLEGEMVLVATCCRDDCLGDLHKSGSARVRRSVPNESGSVKAGSIPRPNPPDFTAGAIERNHRMPSPAMKVTTYPPRVWTFARLASAGLVAVTALLSNQDALAHGDVHESIVAVTAEIEKSPQQADLFIRRASLHRAHQDWARALADLEQAQKLDPSQTALDLPRGELLTELAKFKEAEVLLTRFRDAYPASPRGWAALGRLNAQQLKWDAAAADYGKAVELTQPPDPHLYLNQVEALRGAGKLEDAGRVLDGAITVLGNLPSLVQPAVDIAIERKTWDRAVQLLDDAAAASVRKERWLMKKGEVLEKAGKFTEALETFRRALAEFETLPPNRRGVAAMIAFEQGLRTSIERVEQGVAATPSPEPK